MNETIQKDLSWIQRHEKLLIIILAAIFLWFSWGKYVDWQSKHDDTAAAVAQERLKQQVEDNAKLAQVVAANDQNYKILLAQITAQNQQLVNAMSARERETKKQQEADRVMPLPELAVRWTGLLKLQPTEIKNVNNELVVSDNAAHVTVVALEEIPKLTEDVKTLNTLVDNGKKQLADRDKAVTDLNAQVVGKDAEIEKQATANKAEQDKLKAEQRKKSRNWFIRGAIIGGGVAVYALHAVGIF